MRTPIRGSLLAAAAATALAAIALLAPSDAIAACGDAGVYCTDSHGYISYPVARQPSDRSDCTWTLTVAFGDGTSGTYRFNGTPFLASHTYPRPGIYPLRGTATNGQSPSGKWICPDYSLAVTIEFPAPPNGAPIAKPDHWTIRAGEVAEANVLENDSDPDGEPLTAKVLKISFAHREWSGLEPDGEFLYTAGPGTTVALRKRITYVAVDAKGTSSAPAQAVVDIVQGTKTSSPLKSTRKKGGGKRHRDARALASAAAGPYWDGPWTWAPLCWGSGIHTECWTMLSVSRARELNADRSWQPDYVTAARWCLKYGLLPIGVTAAGCAKTLLKKGWTYVYDRATIWNAARLGTCLLSRIKRHRTLSHPLSGEWGRPEYLSQDSLTTPYNGNPDFTGYGKWYKGGVIHVERWRIPLFCGSNGWVYRLVNGVRTVIDY